MALLGAVAVAGPRGPARTAGAEEPGAETAADEGVFRFFTDPRGLIPTLRLTISEADCDRLRADPRTWVKASLREGEKTVHEDVGVHLKGSVGSCRPLDDKPGFTVRMTKFVKGRRFHGLTKFHLNNSVQDPTYMNEFVASEMFRAAGVPAPFVTHARVWLNGRDLGTYVLKEGFDDRFLRRAFRDPAGNLYDGGFCTDIDSPLEKDEGEDPEDRTDLESLLGACQTTDPVRAKEAIAAQLNVEALLTLAALERMLRRSRSVALPSMTLNNVTAPPCPRQDRPGDATVPGPRRPFLPGDCANPRGRPRAGGALAEHIRQQGGEDGKRWVFRPSSPPTLLCGPWRPWRAFRAAPRHPLLEPN